MKDLIAIILGAILGTTLVFIILFCVYLFFSILKII